MTIDCDRARCETPCYSCIQLGIKGRWRRSQEVWKKKIPSETASNTHYPRMVKLQKGKKRTREKGCGDITTPNAMRKWRGPARVCLIPTALPSRRPRFSERKSGPTEPRDSHEFWIRSSSCGDCDPCLFSFFFFGLHSLSIVRSPKEYDSLLRDVAHYQHHIEIFSIMSHIDRDKPTWTDRKCHETQLLEVHQKKGRGVVGKSQRRPNLKRISAAWFYCNEHEAIRKIQCEQGDCTEPAVMGRYVWI